MTFPKIGITWSPYLASYMTELGELADYIEISYEQIQHGVGEKQLPLSTILHCASLSVAGFNLPADSIIEKVHQTALDLNSPWIGEHLAYISGDSINNPETVIESTFTLCPQLSTETVTLVVNNWHRLQNKLSMPLILENPPQYFSLPGSTMTMADFMAAICERCDANLLIDLAHWFISAQNMGLDPYEEASKLPYDRITEIHLSGCQLTDGRQWDNHAAPPNEEIWDLLVHFLDNSQPQAITLEYNWLTHYKSGFFEEQMARVRSHIHLNNNMEKV